MWGHRVWDLTFVVHDAPVKYPTIGTYRNAIMTFVFGARRRHWLGATNSTSPFERAYYFKQLYGLGEYVVKFNHKVVQSTIRFIKKRFRIRTRHLRSVTFEITEKEVGGKKRLYQKVFDRVKLLDISGHATRIMSQPNDIHTYFYVNYIMLTVVTSGRMRNEDVEYLNALRRMKKNDYFLRDVNTSVYNPKMAWHTSLELFLGGLSGCYKAYDRFSLYPVRNTVITIAWFSILAGIDKMNYKTEAEILLSADLVKKG
jgi:hypothetical protein